MYKSQQNVIVLGLLTQLLRRFDIQNRGDSSLQVDNHNIFRTKFKGNKYCRRT